MLSESPIAGEIPARRRDWLVLLFLSPWAAWRPLEDRGGGLLKERPDGGVVESLSTDR
jgi:hypothetical protein